MTDMVNTDDTVQWRVDAMRAQVSPEAWALPFLTWLSGIVGTARETNQVGVLVLNRRRGRRSR